MDLDRLCTEELLAALKASRPEAQRALWKGYWPVVHGVCRRILGEGLPASEVAVEVLSDFLSRYVHGLSRPRAIGAYLRLVAARRAVKESERFNRPIYDDMDSYLDSSVADPEMKSAYKLLAPRLEECLRRLGPKAQQVVKLRYYQELTNEQIGTRVGGSKQYIGRLLKRCLVTLRKCLSRRRPEVAPSLGGGN